MLRSHDSRKLRRGLVVYGFGFLLIVVLASLSMWGAEVAAHGSEVASNGTLPPPVPEPLRAKVTFVHAAPFATPIDATAIDICDQANQVVGDLTGIVFQQVESLTIDPKTYLWKVATSDSGCANVVLALPVLNLAPGSQTLVVITGDGDTYPIASIVTTLNPGGGIWYLPLIIAQEE